MPKKQEGKLSGSVGSIVIDPKETNILYLGFGYRPSSDGTSTVKRLSWSQYVYKSLDYGESWSRIKAFNIPTKVYQLVHSPAKAGVVYAATEDGLYIGKNGKVERIKNMSKSIIDLIKNKYTSREAEIFTESEMLAQKMISTFSKLEFSPALNDYGKPVLYREDIEALFIKNENGTLPATQY